MGTIFDPTLRQALHRRLDALTPSTPPAWGRLSAPEVVSHLTCAFRAGLGELAVGPPRGPFTRAPLNLLVIHLMPWPKGKAESPREFLGVAPGRWTEDLATLHALLDRTGERDPAGSWPVSPAFGRISGKSWGVLQYRHLDHHLRQFGV